MAHPEGPSTQYLRTLVPKTIEGMAFGNRNPKSWVLGPSEARKQANSKPSAKRLDSDDDLELC